MMLLNTYSVVFRSAIFPCIFIWHLNLALRRKIGLIALLGGSLIAFL